MGSRSSLLWALESNAAPTSYLFGTMHVRSHVAHQFIDGVNPYVQSTEIFAAEINLDDVLAGAVEEATRTPVPFRLDHYLGDSKYQRLRAMIWKSFGVELDPWKSKHPMLLLSAISETLLVNVHAQALDGELWNRARSMGKDCVGLESFREQMELMNGLSVADGIKQIVMIGRQPARFRRNLRKLIEHYAGQDIFKLYTVSKRQLHGLRRKMLYDRNVEMVRRLGTLMDNRSVFAAVGAAHLAGERGMLRLIKKSGYRVSPIQMGNT